jgi:putative peptidoglycan lipid II flippase
MIRRLLKSEQHSVFGAAAVLAGASLLAKVVGIFRDRLFAHTFGAGDILDAYYAAFRIPDFLFETLLVGALSAALIPRFSRLRSEGNHTEAWTLINGLINIFLLTLGGAALLAIVAAGPLTDILVPGFTAEKRDLTILLTRIMLISPIILGISNIVSGVVQAEKAFVSYALSPLFYNIGIIVGAMLAPTLGPPLLGVGVIIGSLLHLGIQLPALYQYGFRYTWALPWKNPHIIRVLTLTLPRALGLGAHQVGMIVLTTIASTLMAGSLTVFTLALHVQSVPVGLLGVSVGMAAFPLLAKLAAKHDFAQFRNEFMRTVHLMLTLLIPITILFLLLRGQLTRILLGSGAFDWNDTRQTADTLAFFAFSLFAQTLLPLLTRTFFALEDTHTPFIISLIGILITIFTAKPLSAMHVLGGVPGLSAAFSLGIITQFSLLWVCLRKKIGELAEHHTLILLYKISFAGLCMATVMQWAKTPVSHIVNMQTFLGVSTQAILVALLGLCLYICLCILLRVEEIRSMLLIIRARIPLKAAATESPTQGIDAV